MSLRRTCTKCGFERNINDGNPQWRCPKCEVVYPDVKEINQRAYDLRAAESDKPIMITTETHLPDLKIKERLGIVTSECVFGMNIIKDAFAAISDMTGGRSKTTQKGLRDAKNTCLRELANEAKSLGADAVIAVDLDYSEFSGGGVFGEKSMLFLVASGTAVKLEKEQPPQLPGETGRNPFFVGP
jgi:uncharacterized protein YbjQ (UPF0145 family)